MLFNRRGFTLIEVLIATTLVSFMMIAIYTITTNNTDTKDRIVKDDREYIQLEVFFQRLEKDFSNLYSPLFFQSIPINDPQLAATTTEVYNRAKFQETESFPVITAKGLVVPATVSDEKQELSFMSVNNKRILAESKQSLYSWVKYSLVPMTDEDVEDQPSFDNQVSTKDLSKITRSILKEDIFIPEVEWDDVPSFTILERVKSFSFSFWSTKKRKFVSSLNATSSEKNNVRMIKVDLEWVDLQGVIIEYSRTFRTSWPFFDTGFDERERLKAMKPVPSKVNTTNSTQPVGSTIP